VAVDLPRNLLFLAVGTHISPRLMFQTLANLGARDGMLLDGGDSSSMAIGTGSSIVSPGVIYGWRPVANQLGVRAEPLKTGTQLDRLGQDHFVLGKLALDLSDIVR
jgi:hypothetical protein